MSGLLFGVVVLVGAAVAAHQLHRFTFDDFAPADLHDVFDDDVVLGGRLTYVLHDEAERLAAEPITCTPKEEETTC